MTDRQIARTLSPPPAQPGFIGPGHLAVEVVAPIDLAAGDPFVLLMDDRLDLAVRRRIGDAHPHAGLETVTLVIEGSLWDRDEGELAAGDAVWMTAGSGIIHNEHAEAGGRVRVLQLWIRLPARDRDAAPGFEVIRAAAAPVRREPGATARLYSGTTGALRSPTGNHAPITLVDLTLAPGASFTQDLPLSYNGFAYVLDGDVAVGNARVPGGNVAWLDRPAGEGSSSLTFTAGPGGSRLVLYAGAPQHEPLVHRGPFVAGSETELREQYRRYRAGVFDSMSAISARHRPARPSTSSARLTAR